MTDTTIRNSDLHMVQMWLDTRRLAELARALRLPLHSVDNNYLVHCALGELFGDRAPGPFCVEQSRGKHLRVLAYASDSHPHLQAHAEQLASPMVYQICDWSRLASKPMPQTLPRGTALAFGLRACPVVRKSSAGKHHSAGVEVDAFLSRVWEVDDPSVPLDRGDVYVDWLLDQFRRRGGACAEKEAIHLESFTLQRMLRRPQGNGGPPKVIKRPVVTFAGTLEVADSEEFSQLLRRGIGRHRSFGFGMLKVRPAGS